MEAKKFIKECAYNIQFEVEYFLDSIRTKIYQVRYGFSNLKRWFRIIWNDRWYDYGFIDTMLEEKFKTLDENWDCAHYVGSEFDHKVIKEVLKIYKDLAELEDECTLEAELEISNKYQELGILLYSINHRKIKYEGDKTHENTATNIERLWD